MIYFLSLVDAEILIHAFVSSRLDFCNVLLSGLPRAGTKKLQMVQKAAARILTNTRKFDHATPILTSFLKAHGRPSCVLPLSLSLSLVSPPCLLFSLTLLCAGPSAVLRPLSSPWLSQGAWVPQLSLTSCLSLSFVYMMSLSRSPSVSLFSFLLFLYEWCAWALPLVCLCSSSSFQVSIVERRSCGSGPVC